jgi:hypothetical protein
VSEGRDGRLGSGHVWLLLRGLRYRIHCAALLLAFIRLLRGAATTTATVASERARAVTEWERAALMKCENIEPTFAASNVHDDIPAFSCAQMHPLFFSSASLPFLFQNTLDKFTSHPAELS